MLFYFWWVKVRGHRVDLTEIESAVLSVEAVARASVLCYRPGETDQKILCYFVPREVGTSSIKRGHLRSLASSDLRTALSRKLPDYMMPLCLSVPTLPQLASGKVGYSKISGKPIILNQFSVNCPITIFNLGKLLQTPDLHN